MWLHRRFASKGLINLLHAMGTCASYQETANFETSAVHHARPAVGFHLLMSYMGAIDKIMGGSGMEELWETVYGKNTLTCSPDTPMQELTLSPRSSSWLRS